jgi:hypothetical protein
MKSKYFAIVSKTQYSRSVIFSKYKFLYDGQRTLSLRNCDDTIMIDVRVLKEWIINDLI